MPNIKSKIKNTRRIEKRTVFNRAMKNKIKTLTKTIYGCLEDYAEEKKETVTKLFSLYYKAVDKALKRKIVKKNAAARHKSRMAKVISNATKTNPKSTS